MNCRRADQLFSAAWEDELTLVEREALESHMTGCAACRVAYDEFVRVMEAVQGLPKMEAGTEFVEGVWSRIRAVESPARVRRLTWSWGGFQPALAAAACLVVIGGAIAYLQHNASLHPGASPSPALTEEKQQAPSPVAMAPAQPAQTTPSPEPAKVAERARSEAAKPVLATEVATTQLKTADESANRAPAPASLDAHLSGVRAGEVAFAKPLVAARQDSASAPDSLFDHSYDMEFALDPVRLSKSAKGKLSPSRPMPTEVQGKPAKVTF